MIQRYGALILRLEQAFGAVLADAPPLSEFEADMTEGLKDFNRSMWPDMLGSQINFIEEAVEALPLSGVRKKIDRIREFERQCNERFVQTFTAADSAFSDPQPSLDTDDTPAESAEETDDIDSQLYDGPRKRLAFELRALRRHILDELEDFRFLLLDEKATALFESAEPLFGPAVFTQFNVANHDIEEAGKCLALGRWTATVLHLMRALEPALTALEAEVQTTVPKEQWHNKIDQIEKAIDDLAGNRHPTKKATKDEVQWYSEAATHFRYIKDAWRNYAAHGRDTYDEARARRIYENVRDFMISLASRFSEPAQQP